MIQGSCTDFTAVYTVLKLEKKLSDVLEQYYVLITFILPSLSKERNSNEVSRRIFKHRAFFLELHFALNYACLWWVRSPVLFRQL